jgi:hypothetical protein
MNESYGQHARLVENRTSRLYSYVTLCWTKAADIQCCNTGCDCLSPTAICKLAEELDHFCDAHGTDGDPECHKVLPDMLGGMTTCTTGGEEYIEII